MGPIAIERGEAWIKSHRSPRSCQKVDLSTLRSTWGVYVQQLLISSNVCSCLRRGGFAEILCKPKILPLKSAVLEQLQKLEQSAEDAPPDSTFGMHK